MQCLSVLEKNSDYEIIDESKFCPRCGIKTKDMEEDSSVGKKCLCGKCRTIFIKEISINCENKRVEIRLKKL